MPPGRRLAFPKAARLQARCVAIATATEVKAPAEEAADERIIDVRGLSKSFGSLRVLVDVDLDVVRGEMFGLIGPSGCGKTTLVRTLIGQLKPTDGKVSVLGRMPTHFSTHDREAIGYSPQLFFLYPTLTVMGNALFVARLYGLGWRHRRRRAREVLQFLDLWEARNRLSGQTSGGMQRRLLLATALMHDPKLLIVDEPTAGLDPAIRQKIWEHLQHLRDGGTTIFLTTQFLDEAEYCDRVAVMSAGSVVAVGTPDELRREALSGEIVEIEVEKASDSSVAAALAVRGVLELESRTDKALRFLVDDSATVVPLLMTALRTNGATVQSVRPEVPTFDEVFLKLVRR